MLVRDEVSWDKTAEVVVIGYGMAGAVAAITAHDQGANVLLLEKQPSDDHYTNSSLSGGLIVSPSDVEGVIRYMEALNWVNGDLCWTDRDIIRAFAEYSFQNKDWMEKLGAETTLVPNIGEHAELPGADSIRLYNCRGGGHRMMNLFYDKVRARGIEVMYSTAAADLLTGPDGEVVGVRGHSSDGKAPQEVNIEASRAVILTCGGFEFDERMKLNYLRVYPVHFWGSPANTGDGIRMAVDVGADLWHMSCLSAGITLKVPDYPLGSLPQLGGRGWYMRQYRGRVSREPAGYIVVDRNGERFINENFIASKLHSLFYELTVFDTQRLEYPRVPCYWMFDQSRMEAGPLTFWGFSASQPQRFYKWSEDNSKELEKGWIIAAETVRELALRLDMQPDALDRTVKTYNLYCERGTDPDFGREALDLAPLVRPPFYATKLWPGGPNTQGGPKRNCKAQVLNTRGSPIPRLYSAGELGSIFGMIYPSGGFNLAECIAFGRIAGENAVREERRGQE